MNSEGQWTVYRTRFLVRARQITEPLIFIDTLGREQSGEPGDYLVESSDGVRRVTTRAIFEDIYVPLEPTLLLLSGSEAGNAGVRNISPNTDAGITASPVSRASPELRSYPSA
jgi:hypothetical protein